MHAVSDLHLSSAGIPENTWSRIAQHDRRLLILNYEGTLVPMPSGHGTVKASRLVRRLLCGMAANHRDRIVVISRRPVDELRRALGRLPVHLVGEHGWEETSREGRRIVHSVPGESARRLGLAARAANACGWRPFIERQRCSILFRSHGLGSSEAAHVMEGCRQQWTMFFERDGLAVRQERTGLELRASGRSKSIAVTELIRAEPLEVLPVYVGDDESDEEAFARIRSIGISLRVGEDHVPTMAEWILGPQESVAAFMSRWIALSASRPRPA